MQRRKLGTAVIWMVCLLGVVAVVWSRPPMSGSRNASHPPLALAAEDPPNPVPQNPGLEVLPPAGRPLAMDTALPAQPGPPNERDALPALALVRDLSPYQVTLKTEGNRLWVTVQWTVENAGKAEHRIAADYHLTTDSMLYGIITSSEGQLWTVNGNPDDRIEADAFARELFDQPFAIRYRLDEGTLTVKDFKMGPIAGDAKGTEDLQKAILGCYHTAPAPAPAPPAGL